jgi:hypothetical protein
MKLVMMIVDSDHADDIERMCEECDVPGYTKIPDVLGKGTTGKKQGSRAFPGSSTVYFAALEEHCIEPLKAKLTALRDTRGSEEGLKAFILDTEELL